MVPKVLATFARHRLDALVAIGGEGTLGAADRLFREHQVPVVGVPKTIDNDLDATDFTFGFFSAVEVATRAMDDLRSTAESHGRVMVVECMGRHAGWITAYAGVAAGAEAVLVPEREAHLEELCANLAAAQERRQRSAIVAVAEGARCTKAASACRRWRRTSSASTRPAACGDLVASASRRASAGRRGHSCSATCSAPASRSPSIASSRCASVRAPPASCSRRRFGLMAAMRAGEIVDVPLQAAVAARKTLTKEFLDRYESFFLPIGGP
jgi:6-phosphofructokinase